MSFDPLVTCTSISSSSLSILIALIPVWRTFEYCDRALFFTVPFLVQKRRNCVSLNSRTGTIALICVSGETLIRLTIGFPLAARPAWGTSWTFSQKQRPSSVEQRRE